MRNKGIFIEMSSYAAVQAGRAACCLAFDVSCEVVSGQPDEQTGNKAGFGWEKREAGTLRANTNPWEELLLFLLLLTLVSQSATEEWLSPFGTEVYIFMPQTKADGGDLWLLEEPKIGTRWVSRSEQYEEINTVRGYYSEGVTKVMDQHYERATMVGSHPSKGPPWLWYPD